ncbi:cytochrome C oxidase subunit IV family protein [Pullulanibacillus sp. KACC 23026]|uniref:cytochrome o ubiquinol oxidase subunit IV n=1 Tax=Pullulanibacillus sp. KACC 23026 TaxID=3028315 RepID=UPI0023B13881|nr:cytochrome C oxidase subunit IV family protein [Pullulanibacillus sp. KACC 23026]WEG12070.1 cytochrome C oxidase subunit IV family protein [Pullulanibacillus sp. KACC 23026]
MSQTKSNPTHTPMIPMKNLVGFILSLILTFAALWLGLSGVLSFAAVIIILLILACLQIAVQLYFFMHFSESDGPKYHIIGLSLGLFFAFCVIAGSIWIMTFNAQVQ